MCVSVWNSQGVFNIPWFYDVKLIMNGDCFLVFQKTDLSGRNTNVQPKPTGREFNVQVSRKSQSKGPQIEAFEDEGYEETSSTRVYFMHTGFTLLDAFAKAIALVRGIGDLFRIMKTVTSPLVLAAAPVLLECHTPL